MYTAVGALNMPVRLNAPRTSDMARRGPAVSVSGPYTAVKRELLAFDSQVFLQGRFADLPDDAVNDVVVEIDHHEDEQRHRNRS